MDRNLNEVSTDKLTMRPRLSRRDFLEHTWHTGGSSIMTQGTLPGAAAVDDVAELRRPHVAAIPVRVKVNGVDYRTLPITLDKLL